jgi:hypothetical protein
MIKKNTLLAAVIKKVSPNHAKQRKIMYDIVGMHEDLDICSN